MVVFDRHGRGNLLVRYERWDTLFAQKILIDFPNNISQMTSLSSSDYYICSTIDYKYNDAVGKKFPGQRIT